MGIPRNAAPAPAWWWTIYTIEISRLHFMLKQSTDDRADYHAFTMRRNSLPLMHIVHFQRRLVKTFVYKGLSQVGGGKPMNQFIGCHRKQAEDLFGFSTCLSMFPISDAELIRWPSFDGLIRWLNEPLLDAYPRKPQIRPD
jgi:hypothetical protein